MASRTAAATTAPTTSTTLSTYQTTSTPGRKGLGSDGTDSVGTDSVGITSITSSGEPTVISFTVVVTPSSSLRHNKDSSTEQRVGAGIGIAVAVVVVLFAAAAFIFHRRRRRRVQPEPETDEVPDVAPILQHAVKMPMIKVISIHKKSSPAIGELPANLDYPKKAKRVTKTVVELP